MSLLQIFSHKEEKVKKVLSWIFFIGWSTSVKIYFKDLAHTWNDVLKTKLSNLAMSHKVYTVTTLWESFNFRNSNKLKISFKLLLGSFSLNWLLDYVITDCLKITRKTKSTMLHQSIVCMDCFSWAASTDNNSSANNFHFK